jgi:murein DD-endopeptidase MepM/ murein hydrolase activator NlpD
MGAPNNCVAHARRNGRAGRCGWLRRSVAVVLAGSCALLGMSAIVTEATRPAAAAGISSDRAEISLLEQRLFSEGNEIASLVQRYDVAIASEARIEAALTATEIRLSADRRAEAAARAKLRQVAIDSYVTGGGLSPAQALLSSSSTATSLETEYIDVAGNALHAAALGLELARHRTAATKAALLVERGRAEATVRRLATDRQVAESAVQQDQVLLSQVRGNLTSALAELRARLAAEHAAQRRALKAAQFAAERAAELAAQQAKAAQASKPTSSAPTSSAPTSNPAPPSQPSPPPAPPSQPAPSGVYDNPLRAVSDLYPERVDQGVDYSGSGPIYALGDGVVLNTVNAGWPGGTFITYRLTDGPAAGLVVYAAEDIQPLVSVGQTVTPSTEIGLVYEGQDGIETGWAAPAGTGYTMAYLYNQFFGWNSTAFGYNFSQLLVSLGSPGGILQNNPPTGTLPSGWPSW